MEVLVFLHHRQLLLLLESIIVQNFFGICHIFAKIEVFLFDIVKACFQYPRSEPVVLIDSYFVDLALIRAEQSTFVVFLKLKILAFRLLLLMRERMLIFNRHRTSLRDSSCGLCLEPIEATFLGRATLAQLTLELGPESAWNWVSFVLEGIRFSSCLEPVDFDVARQASWSGCFRMAVF